MKVSSACRGECVATGGLCRPSLSVKLSLVSLCRVFAEFQFILVMRFKEICVETETPESAPCIFSLFYKSTMFC